MRVARGSRGATIADDAASRDVDQVDVAWIGTRPTWLGDDTASKELEHFALASRVTPATQVAHLARERPMSVAELIAAHREVAVVVDIGRTNATSPEVLVDAALADLALVETEFDLQNAVSLVPDLRGKVRVVPTPIDLGWHVPERALANLPRAYVKRFRRLHRLADPSILFVGPYTRAGGLDLALVAAYRLRDELPDVRLAAIPIGDVDQAYLDDCEMQALGLGHRGIVQWTCPPEEQRLWYATTTVVCCPWREDGGPAEVPLLAAAAGRPFVGSELDGFRPSVAAIQDLPALVPPGDVGALVETLRSLLRDVARANELGEAARSVVEQRFSHETGARTLAGLWRALAERAPLNEAA